MKLVKIFTLCLLSINCLMLNAQITREISGSVCDADKKPIAGANVYIFGTIEGCMSDAVGNFRFTTNTMGEITLIVSHLGYTDHKTTKNVADLTNLNIVLAEEALDINEIVITASNFSFGQTRDKIKTMKPLDVVMTGSSNGDIYGALRSLPGTQTVGETGRLSVRGGESDEFQTFINGMHVLVPYTTTSQNQMQRSRFSPFLFKGINFTLGGYGAEYGQALSSILPMQTTDVAADNKLGVSFSPFSANIGGTVAKSNSSFSFNGDFTNMFLYDRIFPDRYNWLQPYNKTSGEIQYKTEFAKRNILKIYIGYDYTGFMQNVEDTLNRTPAHDLKLRENNVYLNATLKSCLSNGYTLFSGIAHSSVFNTVRNSVSNGDRYENTKNEIHVKNTLNKSYGKAYILTTGIENYFRTNDSRYNFSEISRFSDLSYWIGAYFIDNQIRIAKKMFLNFAGRVEYTDYNNSFAFMPRMSLSYTHKDVFQFSGIYGSYTQLSNDNILMNSKNKLKQEKSEHYILAFSRNMPGTTMRAEIYRKKYAGLPLAANSGYVSEGYGYSDGVDFFVENETLIRNLRLTVSYSFNDSKRYYLDYTEPAAPRYAGAHNAAVSLRYFFRAVKTYIGISDIFTSGRPYHDPGKTGFHNSKTAPTNSLDVNLTFLLKPNVILYTSLTNVLNRQNVYNYRYSDIPDSGNRFVGVPVVASRDRFFYVGIFISLNNSKAYDISNY